MDFEDFAWNFNGLTQTNIAMPSKRAGQDW